MALVYIVLFVYLEVRTNTKDMASVTSFQVKALIGFTAVTLAVLTQYLASLKFKRNLFRFIIGASLTLLVSLPLGATYVYRAGPEISTLDPRSIVGTPPSAIVFLLLDELSPAYNSALISAPVNADFQVTIREAKKAGPSTL